MNFNDLEVQQIYVFQLSFPILKVKNILRPFTAYVDGKKKTNTFPTTRVGGHEIMKKLLRLKEGLIRCSKLCDTWICWRVKR